MSGVEVNECKVLATTSGAEWWIAFRNRFEPAGRIKILTASIAGDMVHVACEDKTHAKELVDLMVDNGMPKTATRICAALEGEQ